MIYFYNYVSNPICLFIDPAINLPNDNFRMHVSYINHCILSCKSHLIYRGTWETINRRPFLYAKPCIRLFIYLIQIVIL